MALSVFTLVKTAKRTAYLHMTSARRIATSSRLNRAQEGHIIGPWKGFGKPAWSVEEKLLSKQTESRVTASDVKRIANLSYLHLEDDKVASLTKDMDNILKSVAAMEEIDTTNIKPLLSILEEYSLKTRPDVARSTTHNSEDGPSNAVLNSQQSQNTEEEWGYVDIPEPKILDNASLKEMGFFVVPKQKQPWEEDSLEEEGDDIKPLRDVQKQL